MERTEQALAPQWLRCTGNVAGNGLSTHSDISSSLHSTRSRSFRSNSEKHSPRFLDRSSFFDSRNTSSSNGSSKHPYGSFTRSHRDKTRDKEKEKSLSDDNWGHAFSDPLASILTSRVDKNGFRRSQSLVSRKPGEVLPRIVEDSKKSIDSKSSSNGVLSGRSDVNGIKKSAFEKDFPSLGAEEKQDVNGIRRISSPSLSSAVQSLPIGSSSFLGGEKWTSALAEVPDIISNNGPFQQNGVTHPTSSSASMASSPAGLNMAEALSQPQAQVRATPQLPDKSQRLEELAIKQSRQLIPMTPSMPKPLVKGVNGLNTGDKSKQPKIAVRTNDITVASKGVQPQPHSPHLSNHSRAGQNRPDSPNTPHSGKFLVLKPRHENGTTISTKDSSFSNCDANSMVSSLENKAAALSLSSKSPMDKKSQSLARSRSEFFNLMRKKTAKTIISDSSLAVPSPSTQTSSSVCPPIMENVNGHDEISEKSKDFCDVGEKNLLCNGAICPDEEEAAFLRSLGWEENGGEDEGLTEEEINAFYQEYMNTRPSLELCKTSQAKYASSSESKA